MEENITKHDGFATHMAVACVAAYPVVRAAQDLFDDAVEAVRRQNLVNDASNVVDRASQYADWARRRITDAQLAMAAGIGEDKTRTLVRSCEASIDANLSWFNVENITAFVKANKVAAWDLRAAMVGLLADPVRKLVSEVRDLTGPSISRGLRHELLNIEHDLVSYAEEMFKADISLEHEPNLLARRSFWRFVKWVLVIGVPFAVYFITVTGGL